MGVTVQWDDDAKTVIRYDFEGDWDWTEFGVKAQEAFAMTRSVEHKVDTISNFKPGAKVPQDAFFQFRRAMTKAPKNRGITVIVGATLFIRTLVTVFSRIYKQLGERLQLADSLEQAQTILQERREREAVRQAQDATV
jgi:hypothetical protein